MAELQLPRARSDETVENIANEHEQQVANRTFHVDFSDRLLSDDDSCYETNDDNGEKTSLEPTTETVLAELEINHLKTQVQHLHQTKDKLEKQYRQKCISEQRVLTQVRQLRLCNAEREQQLSAESRRDSVRSTNKICRLEVSLERRKQELSRLGRANQRLEQEKESLLDRLVKMKQRSWDGRDSTLLMNKKVVSERERSLVRKSATLSNQIGRLERQCKTLQVENDHLKTKMAAEKERPRTRTRDEREVQLLKKKKEELSATVNKLQEKLKMVQKETNKKATLEKSIHTIKRDLEYERTEHAQMLLGKDREIESLLERCDQLSKQLDGIVKQTYNGHLSEESNDLERILHQAAKERLSLEHQVSLFNKSLQSEAERCRLLEETNDSLLHQLEELRGSYRHVEKQLEEKFIRCEDLTQWIEEKSRLCSDLETQLRRALDRNSQLSVLNSDLQKQLDNLQNVNEECQELRSTLGTVETEYESAKLEVGSLHNKVDGLESVLRQMREAAEKRKELEREHAEALEQLVHRQQEIKKLHKSQESEKNTNLAMIEHLQSKLRELDKKCELQNVRHEELILEMASIKRSQGKGSGDWLSSPSSPAPGNSMSQEVQTSPPENEIHLSDPSISGIMGRSAPNSPALDSMIHSSVTGRSIGTGTGGGLVHFAGHMVTNSPKFAPPKSPCEPYGTTTPSSALGGGQVGHFTSSGYSSSSATVPCTSTLPVYGTSSSLGSRCTSPMPGMRSSTTTPIPSRTSSPLPSATSTQIDLIMAKIEQDNKILAELDKTRATIGLSSTISVGSGMSSVSTNKLAGAASETGYLGSYQSPLHSALKTPTGVTTGLSLPAPCVSSIPTIITTSFDGDVNKAATMAGLMNRPMAGLVNTPMTDNVSAADYLDIPGKGHLQVFIARYAYDPLQHSPNENPEAELAVNAGDYIYVSSGMDEDGFYEGELMTGKRGLVPSNFVERLTGEDLLEFQRTVLYGIRDPNDTTLGQQDVTATDDNQVLIDEYRKAVDMSFINLWDLEEEQEELHAAEQGGEGADTFFSVLVPAPQKLTLERQLHKSILISWSPPDGPNNAVESYDVYVDGLLNTSVKASERTRALIEGVDSGVPHRISVRSVTGKKRTSRDAACTMMIGRGEEDELRTTQRKENQIQNIPIAPSCVRATNVTATSAVISWLPSNSNYQHSVCVNNVEVRLVKPGVYRHTISGLTPNTTYRVSVRVKNIKVPMAEDKPAKKLEMISSFVDFKTLQVGLPDPPLDIQVEAGPQDGTLLVTWLPVTINDAGTSNGAPVTGYAVYADGKKLLDIDSPTGDHALLDLTSLQGGVPKAITVRTKSHDSMSPDSMATKIPPELVKGSRSKTKSGSASSLSSTDESESEPELVELLVQTAHNLPTEFTIYGLQKSLIDGYLDSSDSRSELSDIAEETEDEILSDTAEVKDAKNGSREQGSRDHRTSSRAADTKDGYDKSSRREGGGGRGPRDDRGSRDPRSVQQGKSGRDYTPPHDPRAGRGPPRGEPRSPRGPHDDKAPGHVDVRRRGEGVGRPHRRYDSHGQMIIEPDENLSDKEVYPHHNTTMHMSIPSIEITKDSASEGRNSMDNFSDEEYEMGRNGVRVSRRQHPPYHEYDSRGQSRGHHLPPDHGGQRSSRALGSSGGDYYDREWGPRRTDQYGQMPPGHYTNEYSTNRRRPGEHDDPSLRPRYFRAIFDYDPQTMSPNPNAADEELPFHEGQMIKIFGEMDPDGFYWGEANGKKGYVPGNMVTELPPDQNVVNHHQSSMSRKGGERWGDAYTNLPRRKMVALYDYDPQELSPNVDAEAELSFNTGEVIYVYGDMDEDGFFLGEINGVRGLVPSNFLTEAPPDYREAPRRVTPGPHDTLPPAAGKVSRESRDRERRKAPAEGGQYGQGRSGAQRW